MINLGKSWSWLRLSGLEVNVDTRLRNINLDRDFLTVDNVDNFFTVETDFRTMLGSRLSIDTMTNRDPQAYCHLIFVISTPTIAIWPFHLSLMERFALQQLTTGNIFCNQRTIIMIQKRNIPKTNLLQKPNRPSRLFKKAQRSFFWFTLK